MIVPTRFGLKYGPVPTLALEYEDDSGTSESAFKSVYVHQRDNESVGGKVKKLHVVQLPHLTSTSEPKQVLRQLQQNNPVFLGPRIVKEEQLQKLLQMLVDHLRTTKKQEEQVDQQQQQQVTASSPPPAPVLRPTSISTRSALKTTEAHPDKEKEQEEEEEEEQEMETRKPLKNETRINGCTNETSQPPGGFSKKFDDQEQLKDSKDDDDNEEEEELETPKAFKLKEKETAQARPSTRLETSLPPPPPPPPPTQVNKELVKAKQAKAKVEKKEEQEEEEQEEEDIPSDELEYFSESEHDESEDSF